MDEVREGYKLTELGEIPIEWEIDKLENIFEISTKSINPQKLNELLIHYSLPAYDENKEPIIENSLQIKSNKTLIENNTLLVSKLNPRISRVWKVNIENQDILHVSSTEFINYVPKSNVNLDYFYYVFASDFFKSELMERESGTTGSRKRVTPSDTLSIKLRLPSLYEQQKIAEILSSVDTQIKHTEQLIEKTKELKKGLMQQLLTKGIGHTEFKQSEFGMIPKSWEVSKFINITDVLKCGVASTPTYVDEGIPFLSSQNVKENKIILDKFNFVSKDYHEELTKKVKPQKGDILYTRVGANFGKAAVVNLDFEFSVYVSLTLIRMKKGYHPYFYMELLNSDLYQKIAKNTVFQGGGVPNLNVKEVEKFNMLVPPIEEQQQIAEILSTVDDEIDSYEQEKAKYKELKKGLMQHLLTGKIRVKVDA